MFKKNLFLMISLGKISLYDSALKVETLSSKKKKKKKKVKD